MMLALCWHFSQASLQPSSCLEVSALFVRVGRLMVVCFFWFSHHSIVILRN